MTGPRDVTDHQRAVDALRSDEERQAFLLDLSDALRPLTASADIKQTACVLLGRRLGVSRVNYYEIGGGEFVAEAGHADGVDPLTRGALDDRGEAWQRAIFEHEQMVVEDVRADPRFTADERRGMLGADIAAFVAVFLLRDGRRSADFAVHHRQPRRWTDAEVQLIREVAVRVRDAAERGRAETALRASEEKYRTLFETMTQGYALCELVRDASGRVVDYRVLELNPAFERHVGLPVAAVIGRRGSELRPNLDPGLLQHYARVVETGRPTRFEHHTEVLRRWFDYHAYPRGGDRFALLYEDISERKRRESDQALLAAITTDLVGLDTVQATMQVVGERIGRHFEVKQCTFAEFTDDFESANPVASWVASGAPGPARPRRTRDFLGGAALTSLQAGEPLIVDDARADPRVHAGAFTAVGLRSCIAAPLHRDGRWRFVLVVLDDAPHAWRDSDVELLREIAGNVFSRLERARAEDALRASESWLAGQKEALQAAVQGAPLADSLGVLVRTMAAQAGDGTRCAFYLVDPAGAALRHVVGMTEEYAAGVDGFKVGPDSPACGLAMHTSLPIITPDVRADPLWEPWLALAERTGFRACWSFPIETTSRKMVGTFAMYHREPREATPRDLGVAAVVTRAAAIIVSHSQEADERARAEAALRRANNALEGRVAERTAALAAEIKRRRELTRRLGEAQEVERQRVARDLHDTIGQLTAGLSMAFKAIDNAGVLPPPAAAQLAEAQAIAAALGKEVHSLAVRLRPTSLDDLGLDAALSQLVLEWSGRTGVTASFHSSGDSDRRLPPDVETTIYRVVQEALTNVAKHAAATSVGVLVRRPAGVVSLVVEDDGVGFDPGAATDRLGLLGMRERVDLVGGELEIEAEPGHGTTVLVTIPLAEGGAA
ncbi:MAG: GAF domain-containing protein [Myxococcales bacterium]|nr:GAF domain-containing protein [Myxococcales bacterium]